MQIDPSQSGYPYQAPGAPAAPRTRSRWWIWLVGGLGLVFFSCFGCLGVLMWIGATGPEISVYTGNAVPAEMVATMRDVGALEPDEQLLYFYSDALIDITDSFCFVSDQKVAIYASDVHIPLTVIEFANVAELDLERNDSFFVDSEIHVILEDGTPISFPVSSEQDGDRQFFEAFEKRVKEATEPRSDGATEG